MNQTEIDVAIERAKRLVSLFERRFITESSLIDELVGLISVENFHPVLQSLPTKIRETVYDWAKSLPDERKCEVIYWPLAREVRLSFKQWLQERESQGNGSHQS